MSKSFNNSCKVKRQMNAREVEWKRENGVKETEDGMTVFRRIRQDREYKRLLESYQDGPTRHGNKRKYMSEMKKIRRKSRLRKDERNVFRNEKL